MQMDFDRKNDISDFKLVAICKGVIAGIFFARSEHRDI